MLAYKKMETKAYQFWVNEYSKIEFEKWNLVNSTFKTSELL